MSAKRPPAPPPALAGFTYVDVLGSGGFADVFLYEQHLPRRRVAVKVLLDGRMAGDTAEQFAAEANVMALLSTHPAIVTIYQAGVSDDGRPYLVMEYCPRPNLQVRSRAGAFSVAEALRVGVQVGAAVETAHRARVFHRDIKPANILVTEYNRPALTDFGIATRADAEDAAAGMSIPWSPPEAFGDQPGSGVATDVYALGATVYTLLAGRSPFEEPGGRNGGADLIQRIETLPVPRLDRPDAPPSLQLALDRAMAKRPEARYPSALDFARALQRVQIELAHSVTPIDILDDAPAPEDDPDADGELTRVRGIVSIEPQTNPAAGPTRRRDRAASAPSDSPAPPDSASALHAAEGPDDDRTARRGPVSIAPSSGAGIADDTSSTVRRAPLSVPPLLRPDSASAPGEVPEAAGAGPAAARPDAARRSRRRGWLGVGAGAAAVVVLATVAWGASVLGGAPTAPEASPSASVRPQNPLADVIPPVEALTGTLQGSDAVFTWTNPAPKDGDAYLWYPYTLAGDGQAARVDAPTVTLPAVDGAPTCIAVTLLRADGSEGDERRACTP